MEIDNLKFYNINDERISLYGVFYENGVYRRRPENVAKSVSDGVYALHTHTVFVYDYDYNAPSLEHLKKTHEKMFYAIRQKNPDLPVIILSRPKFNLTDEEKQRLDVIRKKYENAVNAGDINTYFIDGPTLMKHAKNDGTVDGCHPNDLGFCSMSKIITAKLQSILCSDSIKQF